MPSQTNTPDAPHPAKNDSAPSTPEQLQIAALASHDTPAAPSDHLRNQWVSIVAEFDRNIGAFTAYVEDVREHIKHNNQWAEGTDHLRQFIREGRFVTPEGSTFKVCHGHDAVWCREICKRWPDIAPHIMPALRSSKFDRFYRRTIFSDEYVAALAEANAHPEELA